MIVIVMLKRILIRVMMVMMTMMTVMRWFTAIDVVMAIAFEIRAFIVDYWLMVMMVVLMRMFRRYVWIILLLLFTLFFFFFSLPFCLFIFDSLLIYLSLEINGSNTRTQFHGMFCYLLLVIRCTTTSTCTHGLSINRFPTFGVLPIYTCL